MLPSLLLPPSSFHAALTTTLTVTLLSLCYLTSHVDGHGYFVRSQAVVQELTYQRATEDHHICIQVDGALEGREQQRSELPQEDE